MCGSSGLAGSTGSPGLPGLSGVIGVVACTKWTSNSLLPLVNTSSPSLKLLDTKLYPLASQFLMLSAVV